MHPDLRETVLQPSCKPVKGQLVHRPSPADMSFLLMLVLFLQCASSNQNVYLPTLLGDAWSGTSVTVMQEGQPLQLHSAGHSSMPPLDASLDSPYAGRDEDVSNTIAEPVPGMQHRRLTTCPICIGARQ